MVVSRLTELKDAAPQTYPVVTVEGIQYTSAFNRLWPVQNDIALHLNAWREGLTRAEGGLGKLRHLIEAHNLIWPQYAETLHEWTIDRFRAMNHGYPIISLAGGASTAKSADAARYALLWWWALPEERAVIIASTTVGALMKRIWSYVAEGLYKASGNMPGVISNSPPPKILFDRRDPKHGIHGAALKEGNADRTLGDMIGIHPKEGLLFIIDEGTDVTPAVLDVRTNLDTGGEKNAASFQQIIIGNSKSKLDPHGKASEPKYGWDSVNPDTDTQWETKVGGVCLYFDCYKSPAITSPHRDRLPFLIGEKKIRKEEKALGKDHPRFWRFVRGFWPPDDMSKTVLTLSLIDKHRARERAEWQGGWHVTIAGLDPAFTTDGDECILRFATLGVARNGLITLDFSGPRNIISLPIDSRSKEPVNYQILHLAKQECIARGVKPEHFGGDFWGFGLGAGDIIEKHWSDEIHRINGIGAPSENIVDYQTNKRAIELYDRKITELWFAMRTFVENGQIRGLDEETIEEFCSRTYEWKGKKQALEGKLDYKTRMGKEDSPTGSPDRSDAAAIVVEVAQRAGLVPAGREMDEEERSANWEKQWELATGRRKVGEEGELEDREEAWHSDAILDSGMFAEDAFDD